MIDNLQKVPYKSMGLNGQFFSMGPKKIDHLTPCSCIYLIPHGALRGQIVFLCSAWHWNTVSLWNYFSVALHVAQHFLGNKTSYTFYWLENGRLTLPRAYLNSTLDYSFEKLVLFFYDEFLHLYREDIYYSYSKEQKAE